MQDVQITRTMAAARAAHSDGTNDVLHKELLQRCCNAGAVAGAGVT